MCSITNCRYELYPPVHVGCTEVHGPAQGREQLTTVQLLQVQQRVQLSLAVQILPVKVQLWQ